MTQQNKEFNYFFEGLLAFYQLRKEGETLFSNYRTRLFNEFNLLPKTQNKFLLKLKVKIIFSFIYNFSFTLLKLANFIIFFLYRMPGFFIQKKMINALPKDISQSVTVLGISSNRLKIKKIETFGLKPYFLSLLKDFSNTQNDVIHQLNTSQYLFLCEPIFKSPLVEKLKRHHKKDIFIVDIGFLIFLILPSLIKLCFRAIYLANGDFSDLRPVQTVVGFLKRFKSIVLTLIFMESYKLVFNKFGNISSYFLTSNSFATEMLRLYLNKQDACSSVCEILHGVPTQEYESYISTISELSLRYYKINKLSFTSQIPQSLYGFFENHLSEYSINTYLNNFLIENENFRMDLIRAINVEAKQIFFNDLLEDNVIFTFIGGISHDKDFFKSDTFYLECEIIRKIKNIFIKNQRAFKIIYTPHPGNSFEACKKCAFFSNESITLYQNTIFTWLVSDISVSLLSSALFEAGYCGVSSFTPLKIDDNIYPQVLLEKLNYSKGDFGIEIDNFIQNFIPNKSKMDILNRALARATLFPKFEN